MLTSNEHSSVSDQGIDDELDRLIYHISHDLRASTRAMTMVPTWIEEDLREEFGQVPASVSEHVQILTRQADRFDQMLQDLLVYSRVGRMQAVAQVDVGRAIDEAMLKLNLFEGIEITRDLKVASISGGANDLKTLFRILFSNAVKHGGPKIAFSTVCVDGAVELRVQDNGSGIDPKHHARIFEMMTTLRSRDEVEGSGIGLAIARKIATQYRGTIEVISEGAGSGTEFVVTLPQP